MRKVQDYQLNYKDTVLFNIINQEIFEDYEWSNLENKPIKSDYISKDKIKAKIEEIEATGLSVCNEQLNYQMKLEDEAKIQVLQELLEEEG